ncbi:MAG: SAM-dependent DNA methyltransferase, partial [Gammaproteobacteria bacterium]|nr:SAM-dependent DNA methyltransferase [Gammaproteobacteria bacterium]
MPESNLFTDPATDVYPTETPWGPVMAIFDADPEKPGVRFDPPYGPAVHYMREVIKGATGHHGIGFTLKSLSQDDYVDFCQPEGVTIEVPWYLREERESEPAMALDDAGGLTHLDALRAQLRETSGVLARLAIARAILAARESPEEGAHPLTARRPTAEFYSHDERRTKGRRQAANDAAVALLRRVQSGDLSRENLTDADREVLAAYSGNGGALTSADGTIGSDYEYYTPSALAAGAWDLLAELGFAGGKILDPCAGTGVFGATAPANAVVDAVELSEISGQINALVNDGAGYHTTVAPFERVAAATEDETYDAVVTNVPFSRVVDARGGNQFEDPKYQKEPMENYFILRSLEKLKPGGLAAFIVPPRCVSGLDAKQMRLRRSASLMAEFLGAYRLPNHVFGNADADTIVDLMVFRKFARTTATKVAELFEQSPATLAEANVMWEPFLSGKYFQGEGKRFILGEFVPKDPAKFYDVDRVTNPASVPELAKMLKRFGGSRIDWAALNATETAPITYREGDTLYQAGQTLELRNGVWEPRAPSEGDRTNEQRLARMTTAMRAFDSGATAADGAALMEYFTRSGQALDAPDWLRRLVRDTAAATDAQRENLWRVGLIGSAVAEALNHHAGNPRDVLAEIYPELTEAMQRMRAEAAKLRGAFNAAKDAVSDLLAHARAKKALSPRWLGEVLEEVAPAVVDTPSGRIDALLYQAPDAWLAVEDVAAALGTVFDPITDPEWCVSGDGKSVMRADDYYVGSYRDFLDRVERDLARATDPQVRDKILAQKHAALDRLPRIDPKKISYNLHSPYVTDDERIAFLRQFVHPGFSLD